MQSDKQNQKPWLTPDFINRFREALGREMDPEERKFFGIEADMAGKEANSGSD